MSQLLVEAAERHGLVQEEPAPQVFFQEFGDSALNFGLRYWVDVINHNADQVGSDLRHMIAGAFAEKGIAMAFPQRDIHLDAARPVAGANGASRDACGRGGLVACDEGMTKKPAGTEPIHSLPEGSFDSAGRL